MLNELMKIQEMLWRSDDRMDQETLFELQDYVAELSLKTANKEHKVDKLVAKFPFLYEVKK